MMKATNKFAVLINTNGRPDKQITIDTLRKCGYTGKIYLIIDDLDQTAKKYYEKYSDLVIEFKKKEYEKNADTFLNYEMLNTVLYARNASFDIAKELGLEWFIICDDDITNMSYKIILNDKLISHKAIKLDSFFDACIDFMKNTSMECLSSCEEGLYIGGANDNVKNGLVWRMGHFWLFNSNFNRRFRGAFHEDRIFSDDNAMNKCFGLSLLAISTPSFKQNNQEHKHKQHKQHKQEGGMQKQYSDTGMYIPRYFSVIAHPDFNFIEIKKEIVARRRKENADPKILSDTWRK